MKTTFTTAFLLVLCANMLSAQQTRIFNQNASRSNHTRLGLSTPLISISAGTVQTKSSLLGNGFNVQVDAFIPFCSKADHFAIGINVAANYAGVKSILPDDDLAAKKGADFDKAYINAMIDDHQEDIDEFKKESTDGKDADLKTWATNKLPTLQGHLDMAKTTKSGLKK